MWAPGMGNLWTDLERSAAFLRHGDAGMIIRLTVLVLAILPSGCRRAEPAGQPPAMTRREPRLDSALARLCVSPPDTSAKGSGGCVLRDQRPVLVKPPPR